MVLLLCFVLFLSFVEVAIGDYPCNNSINETDPARSPNVPNFDDHCDLGARETQWYFLGGQLTGFCVDNDRCSTSAGIWYGGDYPVGDEIVTGTVCAYIQEQHCCAWTGKIKIKKCSYGFIYQLAIPKVCPIAYCVGPADSCTSVYEIYHEEKNVCLERMWFSEVKLSQPYVSKSSMFGDFNATAFAVDCKLSYVGRLHSNLSRSAVIRVSFKLNEGEIEKYVFNTSDGRLVDTITLEESYLVGHLGKTLICEAIIYYYFPDGSRIWDKEAAVKSKGLYLGIHFAPTKVRTLFLNAALVRCSSVLARFTFFNECKNLIPETLDKIHKNCVDAIRFSGNYNLAWSNLAEYEEACVSFLKRKHVVIAGRAAIENRTLTKMINDIIIESARRVASQRRWNETIEN